MKNPKDNGALPFLDTPASPYLVLPLIYILPLDPLHVTLKVLLFDIIDMQECYFWV